MKHEISIIILILSVLFLGACGHEIDDSLDSAGKNRIELEKVLLYFEKKDDPLRYRAAKFLIQNMVYHYSMYGNGVEKINNVYIDMAKNAKEFRDSIYKSEMQNSDSMRLQIIPDNMQIKSSFLIKAINDACDVWERTNWNKEYDESIFFNYVLPYRLFEESLSDWHSTIKDEFPYLNAPVVYSHQGVRFPACEEELVSAKAVESPSALRGKAVQIYGRDATVTYKFHSGISVQKLLRFRYSTVEKDTKALVEVNGKIVGSYDLEPTSNLYTFRSSRFGMVVNLEKGDNKIKVKFVNKPFLLDYIEVAAYEPYSDEKCEDYSTSYCQIQNIGTKNFVSFDTIQSKMGWSIELHKYSAKDGTLNMRFDYLGYPIWKISPMDSVDLCLEDRWVSLDTLQSVSKYKTIDSNNGDNHQKWVIIPIEGGMCKIMNKLTGLFWESAKDPQYGHEILIQNFYSGKPTQKWKIIKKGANPYAKSFFKIGNVLSEGLRVKDVMSQFEFIHNRGTISPKLSSLCKYRTGICQDEASYTVALSRHLGIPTAIDFTPHWGNRPNNHTWCVLIMSNGKATPFYMGFAPGDTAQFTHSYLKPKIYRRRFEVNREIINDLKSENSVPDLFRNPNFVDVTDEYYETTDVERDIPSVFRYSDIAYICVNDKEEWIPVDYGKISWGKVKFRSMGRNILYNVGIWWKNKIVPIGNPFIIKNDGTIREIVCDKNRKQTMTLYRKYPFFARFDEFNNRMGLGRFEGSNTMDFSTCDLLYTHNGATEGCWYETILKPSRHTYKYLRYLGYQGSFCNVNEIEFYNNKGKKLIGKIIGTQGTDKQTKEMVFDGDVLTGFNGISPDGHWVGLELHQPSDVSKIRYMPRNDGNCVEVGDKYQLLVYDNGKWRTLAWIRARDTKIVLKNMPSNGLYLLRDRTKGSEERVFTYESGKQVWW